MDIQLLVPGPVKTFLSSKPGWVPDTVWKFGAFFAPSWVNEILNFRLIQLNDYYISLWHFVHGFSGWLTRQLGFDRDHAFLIHSIWEAFQLSIEMTPLDDVGAVDVILDTLFFMGGFMMTMVQ